MVKNPPAGLPWWFSSKEYACQCLKAGDSGSIPGSERSPGEGNGKPLQYSCLGNSMDTGAWQATVHGGHKELDTTERACIYPVSWPVIVHGNLLRSLLFQWYQLYPLSLLILFESSLCWLITLAKDLSIYCLSSQKYQFKSWVVFFF